MLMRIIVSGVLLLREVLHDACGFFEWELRWGDKGVGVMRGDINRGGVSGKVDVGVWGLIGVVVELVVQIGKSSRCDMAGLDMKD